MTTDIAKKIKRDGDIRLRRDLEKLDEPIRADQWKNLHFFKDGGTMWGGIVHPTEKAAEKAVTETIAELDAKYPDRQCWVMYLDKRTKYIWSEWSHAIQIPVKP